MSRFMNSFLKMGKYKAECNKVTQLGRYKWLAVAQIKLCIQKSCLEVVKFEGRDIAQEFSHLSILGAL